MNTQFAPFDWSQIQVFLAVLDHGSLSAAARALGMSQPTIGRHIHAMEQVTGTTLFDRHPQGMEISEAGAALIEPARAMQEAARHLNLRLAGRDEDLNGTVRITASVFAAHHVLPSIIAEIRRNLPEISIELVANDSAENLLFREADIAVRMFRPTQLEIITRKIGTVPIGVFAAKSYLERRGVPETPRDLIDHDVIGFDRSDEIIEGFATHGINVDRDFFTTRCDSHTAYWELLRAGCGIGFGQISIGNRDPDLVRLLPELRVPPLEVWLASHERLRNTPRIARVWTMLQTRLSEACEPG